MQFIGTSPLTVTERGRRANSVGRRNRRSVRHWQTSARRDDAADPDVLCDRHARPMVVPGLAEPEGLSDGCGIDTIGSGPTA
jgi:hypothetical protein